MNRIANTYMGCRICEQTPHTLRLLCLQFAISCTHTVIKNTHLLVVVQVTETSQTGSFKRPSKLIEIYEFEGCPFCRKVKVTPYVHITECLCSMFHTQLGITPVAHWCTPLALVMALFHTYCGHILKV